MSLTITQELKVLVESEKPGDGIGPETNPLSELIYQSAMGQIIAISASAKNVDQSTNPLAFNYLRKISGVGNRVLNKDVTTLDTLRKVFVSLAGDSDYTFAQVQGADESDFIVFINTNIEKMFEIAGGVYTIEKTDYDSL